MSRKKKLLLIILMIGLVQLACGTSNPTETEYPDNYDYDYDGGATTLGDDNNANADNNGSETAEDEVREEFPWIFSPLALFDWVHFTS
ncbi:MAG: hypothetical protein N2D54_07860, partial [Chloroflexota bacterium]